MSAGASADGAPSGAPVPPGSGSPGPVAFIDACCLVSRLRREVLFACARGGLFRPRWSARVLDETGWAVARIDTRLAVKAGAEREAAARRAAEAAAALRRQWEEGWPEALVADLPAPEDWAEWLQARFPRRQRFLRDADDMHVLAGAVAAGAGVIVTENLRDFPRRTLSPLGLRALNVDGFVGGLAASAPDAATRALAAARRTLETECGLANPFPLALRQSSLFSALALLGEEAEGKNAGQRVPSR